MAKFLDDNGLLYFFQKLKTFFVKTEPNKGLSTNDYSTADKEKLAGVATGATANAAYQSTPEMNGVAASGSSSNFSKGDHVHPIDTSRAPVASPTFTGTPSAPTAGAGTDSAQIATTAFVKQAVTAALAGVTGMSFSVVASLPGTGSANTIYLLSNSGSAPNIYDEYIWVNSAFEKIGTTAVDLSGYVQSSDLSTVTNAEIDNVVAS